MLSALSYQGDPCSYFTFYHLSVSDRVCSAHFVDDGIPTVVNPDPTINVGYDLPPKK